MAYQLQRLIIILAVAAGGLGAAPRRPFSHKYHLTEVAGYSACEACHTTAGASKSAADNLLPDKTACAICHEDVEVKEPRVLRVQKFNHSLHAAVDGIAGLLKGALSQGTYLSPATDRAEHLDVKDKCAVCHAGIEKSEAIDPKAEGKKHFPRMADCLVCHSKIDPPESCKKCHDGATAVKPATHSNEWVNRHSDKEARIDKTGCAVCHGRNFRCQGCH